MNAISHEVLRALSAPSPAKALVFDGMTEDVEAWLAEHGNLATGIQFLELQPDGSTATIGEYR
jgi:hypothetical protein